MNNNRKQSISNFTGLRGYAILLIFLSHCSFGLNNAGMNRTAYWGAFGVELFIMLSGYLLILNHGEGIVSLKEYLIKKLRRFYPLHIVTLLAAIPFAINALRSLETLTWLALPLNALLLHAWAPNAGIYFSYNAVSWYLSLTLFLILISPLVIRLWNRVKVNRIPFVLVGLYCVEIAWYFLFKSAANAHWIIYIFPVIRSVDYLIGGGICKLAEGKQALQSRSNYSLLAGIVVGLIICGLSLQSGDECFSVCVWTVPSALIILGLRTETTLNKSIFSNAAMLKIGEVSFEVFLIHQLCIGYCSAILSRAGIGSNYYVNALISMIVTALAVTAWRMIYKRKKNSYHSTRKK